MIDAKRTVKARTARAKTTSIIDVFVLIRRLIHVSLMNLIPRGVKIYMSPRAGAISFSADRVAMVLIVDISSQPEPREMFAKLDP